MRSNLIIIRPVGIASGVGSVDMSCPRCDLLQEKMDAIEAAQIDQGFAFVRFRGKVKLVIMGTIECIHRNRGNDGPPTPHCNWGICNPAGCEHWTHRMDEGVA